MINDKRRELQIKAVEVAEKHNFHGFVKLPTGSGKAWVLIEILKRVNPKTCWYLCDSELNRDVTFKEELKKWGAEEWIDRIQFMCYQTAYKLENNTVDLVLADEADFSLTAKYSQVYFNNYFKKLILTSGTLADSKKKLLDKITGVIFEYEIHHVENEGILNKTNYYLVNYLLNYAENERYLSFNRTFAKLLNGIHSRRDLEMLQITRKQFLSSLKSSQIVTRKLIRKLYGNEDNKILVFCGLSSQADAVCRFSFHSKNDGRYFKQFDEGIIRVLSAVAKADRGLNINGVNVIIFESPTKSATKFMQRSGRGRRLKVSEVLDVYFIIPYYIDRHGNTKPTVVKQWVYKAAEKLENFHPKTFKL